MYEFLEQLVTYVFNLNVYFPSKIRYEFEYVSMSEMNISDTFLFIWMDIVLEKYTFQ